MSETVFLSQPFEHQLGNSLVDFFRDGTLKKATFVVAFAKTSGVLRLKQAVEDFKRRNGILTVFIGIDLYGTSYEALLALYKMCTSLYIVHVNSNQTFHPKIYHFESENYSHTIVGSHNLTGGGLWTNMESCSISKLEHNNESDIGAIRQLSNYFARLADCSANTSLKVTSAEIIEELLTDGYIEKEMTIRIRQIQQKDSQQYSKQKSREVTNTILFGDTLSAPMPKLVQPESRENHSATHTTSKRSETITTKNSSVSFLSEKENGYQVFWFETRAMTGGSGNILDLSKIARIEKGNPENTEYATDRAGFMRGGVLFFGMDPENLNTEKKITINYGGVDYRENVIKFPSGKKANGTWRLQIKGKDNDGAKITHAFPQNYLKHKVLVFERIELGYFVLTIFPETELDNFREVSNIVARNGSSPQSRLFGFL